VRLLGDVALLGGRVSYTTKHDGKDREALYTDTSSVGTVAGCVVAGVVVAQGE
jgi:hypothetical protein